MARILSNNEKRYRREYAREYYLAHRDKLLVQSRERRRLTGNRERTDEHRRRDRELYRRKRAEAGKVPSKRQTCEVCGSRTRLRWDHDHDTGAFRGWLCNSCNAAAGFMGDSPRRLRSLAAYIERHSVPAS